MKMKVTATRNSSGFDPNSARSLFGRGALRRHDLCQNVDLAASSDKYRQPCVCRSSSAV